MLSLLVALSLAAPADPPKGKELPEAAKKELKKLEGKWKATKAVSEGREETPTEDIYMEFKDRRITLGGKELLEITALDPGTDPKCLDFTAIADLDAIKKGTAFEAIYKIDGDTLHLAMFLEGGTQRPDKFESPKDSKAVVITFVREKK